MEAQLRAIDPKLQQFTDADRRILGLYGDSCHQNDGTHMDGGIGHGADLKWQHRYRRVIANRHQLYWLPSGRWAKRFLQILTELLTDVRERCCNSEKLLIFAPCILRKTARRGRRRKLSR
jgi:hypothetical protein